jgi:hypothetical protein
MGIILSESESALKGDGRFVGETWVGNRGSIRKRALRYGQGSAQRRWKSTFRETKMMIRLQRTIVPLILASAMLAPVVLTGCATRVRYYDEYGGDYHTWNDYEIRSYRAYWVERHEQYREFRTLNKDEQRSYWQWRHAHPDAGRR